MTLQRMTLLVVVVIAAWSASPASGIEPVSFRKQIAPILLDNCLACHGAKKAESGYRLDNFEQLGKEGEGGSPGFAAKDLDESEAFRLITSDDADERMPKDGDPLSKEQIDLIKRWIEEGTKYDGDDPQAQLAKIVPPPVHPDPIEAYPRTVPVTAMTFSADGKELLVGGYHEVTVWNPADGKLLRRIKNVGQRTYALRISPDGKTLAVACGAPGRRGELRLFEAASGKLLKVLLSTSDVVLDAAFNPKGDKIAAAAADNAIYICDVASGKTDRVIESHSDWVTAIAWSRDGAKLVSASRDKTAKVFDLKTGDLQITYSGHGKPVRGVAFHPDGKEVFSSAADNKIHRWKIADGKKSADVSSFGGEVYKLSMYPETFFAGSADKTVRQFDAKSHKQIRQYAGHQDWVYTTAYHKAVARLASAGFDGEVRVYNTSDGKQVVAFDAAPGYKKQVAKK